MMVDMMKAALFTLCLSFLTTLHLHVAAFAEETQSVPSLRYFASQVSDGLHRKTQQQKFLDISDNKEIDVDALKRGNILKHVGVAKEDGSRREQIGRPVATKDSYSNLGDGVYFVSDNNNANTVSKDGLSKQNTSQDTSAIHDADKKGNDFAFNAAGFNSKLELFPYEADYGKLKDVSAQQSMQTNNVGFIGNGNFEDVSANERSMLQNIESNLSIDDKLTGINMAKQAEREHALEEAQKDTKHMSTFQKLMFEGSKELDLAAAADKDVYANSKKDRVAKVTDIGRSYVNKTDSRSHSVVAGLRKRSFLRKPEEILHYEDVDVIDEQADRRTIKSKKRKKKKKVANNNKSDYNKSKNRRKSRQQAWQKTDSISKGGSFKIGNNAQNEGLVRLLNATDGSNTKFHLRAGQHKLNISKNATTNNDLNIVKTKKKKKHDTLGRGDASLKRKNKSEVERVVGNRQYIASQALPTMSNGFFPGIVPTTSSNENQEFQPTQLENAEQRSYFTSENGGMGPPEVLVATPPDLPPSTQSVSSVVNVKGTGKAELADSVDENHNIAGKKIHFA